jgi:cytochrome c-type protein NapC
MRLLLVSIAAFCAIASAALIVGYLIKRPELKGNVKLWLFLALGPLPILAAGTGNIANYEETKNRRFCSSCHVMHPYTDDAKNNQSTTLASAHSQSKWFGDESCYTCHADYGMFGAVSTKIGGMHHVWAYFTDDWDAPGHRKPKMFKPYNADACMTCHPSSGPSFERVLAHKVHEGAVAKSEVRCNNAGCHGPAHGTVGRGVEPVKGPAPRPDSSGAPAPGPDSSGGVK